jgi:hypothetical protein
MSEIKPPPGAAISRRRAPGTGPRERTRLDETMAWMRARHPRPTFDAGPSFLGTHVSSGRWVGDSALPLIKESLTVRNSVGRE